MSVLDINDPEHLLGEAIYLAAKVHRYQKDKTGVCYTLHALNVMFMRGDQKDREVMIVSVLHDAVEDFEGTGKELNDFLDHLYDIYPREITVALTALTHIDGEPYDQYIERVAKNKLARRVKIRDLTHNMDPRRIPATQIVDKDFKRWDKYRRALIRLERED